MATPPELEKKDRARHGPTPRETTVEHPPLPQPSIEPNDFVVHPWLRHRDSPTDLNDLRSACRLAWYSREQHRLLCGDLEPIGPDPHALAERDQWSIETGPGGPWNGDDILSLVRQFLQSYSATASNHLAAASSLVWNGEYLYSLAPLLRAALESITTGAWLLTPTPTLTPRQRAARLYVLVINDAYRAIDAAQFRDTRNELKETRSRITRDIKSMFSEDKIVIENGRIVEICGQSHPTFDRRFVDFGEVIGHTKIVKRYYLNLSQLSHPNPFSQQILQDAAGYRLDPADVKAFICVGVHFYALFLQFLGGYFGWPSSQIEEWIDRVELEFPGTYYDSR